MHLPSRFLVAVAIFLPRDFESLAHWIKETHAPRNPRRRRWNLGTKAARVLSRLMLIRLGFTLDFDERQILPHLLLRAPRGCLIAAYGQISFVPSLVSVSPILATYLTYGHVSLYPLNWSLTSCLSTYRVCAYVRARARIYVLLNQLSTLKFNRDYI